MKAVLTAAGLLLAAAAGAQPVFNATYGPAIGQQFVLRYANTQEYDQLNISFGANRSWNFNFDRFDSSQITIVNAATAPYRTDFPDADAVASVGGVFSSYTYFKTTTDAVKSLGSVVDLGSFVLKSINNAPYAAVLPYSLTYGGTYTDSTYFRSIGSTGSQDGYQKDTLQYVAYGTLRLNGTSYPDVSVIKQRYYNYNTQGAYTSHGEIQSWFASGYSYPLVTMEVYFDSTSNLLKAAPSYYVPGVTSARPAAERTALRFAPNPASDFARIEGLAPNVSAVTVVSMIGTRQSLPVTEGRINISALEQGVYWIEHGTRRSRLVKE
ncbi:hypothetical protein WDZ92_00300 [Nostoc sp. NIES-2111]